jgi:threonine dehydratase
MGWVAGADGCKAGWIVVVQSLDGSAPPRVCLYATISELLAAEPDLLALAIDMPIGLPDVIEGPGRAAERAVRPLLGARQSSVFSIPVRAAVEAETYGAACAAALAGSNPPRKVSKQGFNLFPKIREIDEVLRADANLAARVYETHPEVVFRFLKDAPLAYPKKSPEGAEERRGLLAKAGFSPALLTSKPPRGAGTDDFLDAIACAHTALRAARGLARPNPDPFPRDRYGLPMAIWI